MNLNSSTIECPTPFRASFLTPNIQLSLVIEPETTIASLSDLKLKLI